MLLHVAAKLYLKLVEKSMNKFCFASSKKGRFGKGFFFEVVERVEP